MRACTAHARRAHFPRVRRHVCGGIAASGTLPPGRLIDRRIHTTLRAHSLPISEVGTRFDADGSLAKQLNSQVFCGNPQVLSFPCQGWLRGSVEQTKQHGRRPGQCRHYAAARRSVVRCGAVVVARALPVALFCCIVWAHTYIYRYIDM